MRSGGGGAADQECAAELEKSGKTEAGKGMTMQVVNSDKGPWEWRVKRTGGKTDSLSRCWLGAGGGWRSREDVVCRFARRVRKSLEDPRSKVQGSCRDWLACGNGALFGDDGGSPPEL